MKGTQIDMKKKRFATIVAALLVISLASCSTPAGSLPSAPDGSHVPEKTQALYSNLTDDSSRREVVDALQAHGVSQEQTDTLLAWADDFNARVTTPTLTEGFTAMEGDFVDYSSLLFDIKELPDGTFFMEANCRLTAFLLMRDQLQTCGTADESDTYLMFDIEARRRNTSSVQKHGPISLLCSMPYLWRGRRTRRNTLPALRKRGRSVAYRWTAQRECP